MLSEKENIHRVKKVINDLMATSEKSIYVIIDGDRTIIPTDSTKFFFEYLNLDFNHIKSIFKQHGYSYAAFYNVAKYYSKIEKKKYKLACAESAKYVEIYPEFLSFMDAVKSEAQLILVTSGIAENWKNIIHRYSLDYMHIIGGSYFPEDNFIVDMNAKGIITKALRNANKNIFAFGDSMIDYEMLNHANFSYLVVNERQNKDLIPLARKIAHLQQISFSSYLHPDIPVSYLKKVQKQIFDSQYES